MPKYKIILLIVFLSLLPFTVTFLSPNLLHTSDGGVQLPRMAAYFKALTDGHIPLRWAGDLNYGYGLPLFNFIYQFPFIITSIFIGLGFGLVLSFKIALWLSFLFSGIFMYIFVRELTGDHTKALFGTIMYMFAPFRLIELLIRGALGGVYAYTFLPLVLFGILKIKNTHGTKGIILTPIALSLLILSHNSLSLIFFLVCLLFTFLFVPSRKDLFRVVLSLALGVALATFFWLPAIMEHKFTYGDLFMKNLYRSYFPPFINFFIPNFFYDKRLLTGEISVQIGLFHLFSIMSALLFTLTSRSNKNVNNKIFVFSSIILVCAFIIMHPISIFLWEHSSTLRQFQFPWRLLAPVTFVTSLLSLSLFEFPQFTKKWIMFIFLFLTIISTSYYWHPREGFDRVHESNFWNYPLNTTYFGETDVIWSAGPAQTYPLKRAEVISGVGSISDFHKKTQLHTMNIQAGTDVRVVDKTQYFPGWRVKVDNIPVPIEFQDQNWRGLITFLVPRGNHTIKITFGESPIRIISDSISLITLLSIILYFYRGKKRYL